MKLALIGYGKMGQLLEQLAVQQEDVIVARINALAEWDEAALLTADCCLEFTEPSHVLSHVTKLAKLKKNIVIGTTGWQQDLAQVKEIVLHEQIGLLYAPNFSIGIHLFLEILTQAAKLMVPFEEYEVAGIEMHHKQKLDTPSGTALHIAQVLATQVPQLAPLSFTSVRCGSMPGTHTLLFDSPCDTLTIQHTARNREGFAKGALLAAHWLQGKQGIYTFSDCLQDRIKKRME